MQVRRDSSTIWTSVNPILAEGEFGLEINTGKIKIGNGTSRWNTLSYITSNLETITSNLQSQINFVVSNLDPTALDSLTEIVSNVNVRFNNFNTTVANISANLINGPHTVFLTPSGNLDLPVNSVFNSLLSTTVNAPIININGESFITGNILPTANVIYNIGSSSARFKDLWLSNSTIHLGSTSIGSDSSGQLVIGQNFDFGGGEGVGGISGIYWNNSSDTISPNAVPTVRVTINPNSQFLTNFQKITQGSIITVTGGSTANIVTLGNAITVTGLPTTTSNPPWLLVDIPVNTFYTGTPHIPGSVYGAYIHNFTVKAAGNKDPEAQANIAQLLSTQDRLISSAGNLVIDSSGNIILPQTAMNVSPAPVSWPGITFSDGSFQKSAFVNNIVNTHNYSQSLAVGLNTAVMDNLSIKLSNISGNLIVEVNYANPSTAVSVTAFRYQPDPVNIYSGANTKAVANTIWDIFGNLSVEGDSLNFIFTDRSFHKVYRATITARTMPLDAYCIIERLKD